MSVAGTPSWSLRQERAESSRLAWAFTISLCLHLLAGGVLYAGKTFGWWERLHWPAWLHAPKILADLLHKKPEPPPPPLPPELPLVFLEVSPSQATPEPPKNPKFYSDKNSKAANADATLETNIPKIDGKQTDIPKTVDVPRETFTPLRPSAPRLPEPKPEEPKPKPPQPPGDLALAKPDQTPKPTENKPKSTEKKSKPSEEKPKPLPPPRTVEEALARHPEKQLPGQKMRQDGGVKAHLRIDSLDAAVTPFGAYDAALVDAISSAWFKLLAERSYSSGGKVVLQFHLHADGRVTDVRVAENSAGELLGLICQKAVLDPAPYDPWPSDMRRLLGERRGIQFTFFYN